MSFDGFKALNDLSLLIDAGELRCVIGPNGAGKTTMMDVITGKTRPDSGTAFFGQTIDLTRLSEPEIADRGIGRKFQKPTVFEHHTVYENLELALKADKRVWPTLRCAARHGRARSHRGDAGHDQADAGGRQRWRACSRTDRSSGSRSACCSCRSRSCLLLDEPVAGMTDDETMRSAELFLSLAGTYTLIVVEHDMEFVRRIAQKVTVLHEGHVLAEGSMDEIQRTSR